MKILSLLLLAFISFAVSAQDFTDLDAPIPVNDDVKIGQLDNGLTYYIRQNKKPENKVELRLVVNAGSILETDEQQGLAHFMEHMNFNGTKNFEHNELVDYLQSIGVKFGQHLNAYTSFDQTVYILPIPSDDPEKLEKGFDILEDWAFNCLLTPEEIDKERGVVLEELRLGLGSGKRMLDRYLPLVMYKSHYADRLPIGKKDIIENFDHEVLKDFYKSWYRPNLMAVVVVGDIDVVEMEKKIQDHFGPYENPKNLKERKEYYVPDHEETFVAIESDKEASFTQVQLMYNDKGKPKKIKTVGDYRRNLTERLFSSMLNSRFRQIVNEPNTPFNYAYSYHGSGWSRNKMAYQSFAQTSPKDQLRAFETLVVENERVRRHGFLQAELDRAKMDVLSGLESSLENKNKTESRRYTYELINHFLEEEHIPGIEWEYAAAKELLDGIKLSEVNDLINHFIHDDNRVVVFTGPEGEDIPKYTKDQVIDVLDKVKKAEIEPYAEEEVASSLLTDMPKPGDVKSKESIKGVDMTKLVLSNGVTVYYKKTDFDDNKIMMRSFSPGGLSMLDPKDYLMIDEARYSLSSAGVNGFSRNDMEKILAGKEVYCYPNLSDDYEEIAGSSVSKDVEVLFQMIHLYFTALNKDKDTYDAFITKRIATYENLMNTPNYWLMNEKRKVREKNNPYYRGRFPTEEDFKNQSYDKAYEVYKERFADASDFTFFFIGAIDEAQIVEFSKTYLASLPSIDRDEALVENNYEKLKGKNEFTFNRGQDPKSSVEIRYRTSAPYDGKMAYYLKCAAEVLSIKLIENLREGESGVYGVRASAYVSRYPDEYYFVISFPCGPENVEKLKKAALSELQKLIENGPTEKDLNKIKEAQSLELKENLKKNRYWLNELWKQTYYGKNDFEGIVKAQEKIDALTGDDIQKALKKFIGENQVVFVLMPEEEKE